MLHYFCICFLSLVLFYESEIFSISKKTLELDHKERNYMFKLMVDYDVIIRNLMSYVSLGFIHHTQKEFDKLSRLSQFQKVNNALYHKIEKKGMWRYIQNIQKIASEASKRLNLYTLYNPSVKVEKSEWDSVQKNIMKITSSCRACHNVIKY